MRKRLFEIIEVGKPDDKLSRFYDLFMMFTIIISLIPLMIYEGNTYLRVTDIVTVCIFCIDYFLRYLTADYKIGKGILSFFIYPFTFLAIIDLLSIMPSFEVLGSGFKVLKIFRLLRTFRVFRAFKIFRYSKNLFFIFEVIKKQKNALITVGLLAIGYVFISALVLFNIEPQTFQYSFFNSLYWATVSLTTMGYGDYSPLSVVGRFFTMASSVVGIAIVALPSGIITAGYMEEINDRKEKDSQIKDNEVKDLNDSMNND